MNAITVKNLSKTYGEHVAVDNLSFTVLKGSVFGLLGANGAGKSTSLECILGTKKMDSDEVFILSENPVKDRTSVFEKTGVQFQ
ncbi:MAG: ATP-binding cassette domain-containing protein, partial [Treponema porcinum]|nr:ATP-binding cassette domain-containing protein [Treponema porcinum]